MPTIRKADGSVEFTDKTGAVAGRWAGPVMSDVEVYRLAAKWWSPSWRAVVATALALAESNAYTRAEGDLLIQDDTHGPSEGLWQIRVRRGAEGTMFDPELNVAAAHRLWKLRGWMPWGSYKLKGVGGLGAFLRYLPRARAAAKIVNNS